jgi:hypothetical protein
MADPGALGNALLRRAFPRVSRDEFDRRMVGWYLDEVHALGDRLRWQAAEPTARADGETGRLTRRIAELIEALAASGPAVLPEVWRRARAAPELPEDVVAPAMILLALEGESPRLLRWLSGLPPSSRQALSDTWALMSRRRK